MKKRIITVFLIVALAATLMSAAFADNSNSLVINGDNNAVIIIQDVANNHWAAEPIATFVQTGVVNGTSNSRDSSGAERITFEPDKTFTRAEFAKVLALACGIAPVDDYSRQTFVDVPPDNWAYPYVEAVAEFMTGYSAAGSGKMSFNPAAAASRQEVMVAAAKVVGLAELGAEETNRTLARFGDVTQISYALRPLIAAVVKYNIIQGDTSGNLNPQSGLTRAEGVTIMKRVTEVPTMQIRNIGVKSASSDRIDEIGKAISATSFTLYGEVPVESRVWIGVEGDEKKWEADVDYSGKFSYTFKNQYTADLSKITFIISAEKNNASAKTEYTVEFTPAEDLEPTMSLIYPKMKDDSYVTINGDISDPIFTSAATDSYGPFRIYINDELKTTVHSSSFTLELNLEYGINVFNLRVMNPNGLSCTEKITIERPKGEVSITVNPIEQTTTEAKIIVSGTLVGADYVTVTESNYASQNFYTKNGKFSFSWTLDYGVNSIELTASNDAGAVASKIITVTRSVPDVTITTNPVPVTTNDTYVYASGYAANAKSVKVTFGGISTQGSYTANYLDSNGGFQFTWNLNNGYGEYTATITAYGADGNEAATKTITITREAPPVTTKFITVQSPATANDDGTELYLSTNSVSLYGYNVSATYRFTGVSSAYMNGSSMSVFNNINHTVNFRNLVEGENIIKFELFDAADNKTTFTVTIFVTVETSY